NDLEQIRQIVREENYRFFAEAVVAHRKGHNRRHHRKLKELEEFLAGKMPEPVKKRGRRKKAERELVVDLVKCADTGGLVLQEVTPEQPTPATPEPQAAQQERPKLVLQPRPMRWKAG